MELYFDAAATTPLLPEVQSAIEAAFSLYGNPSSLHRKGVEAERAIGAARDAVMQCLGVRGRGGRVVFTGGGTEANNLAIRGVALRYRDRGRHLVTTQIEHPSVLETCRALENEGWTVTYVAPTPQGDIRAQDVLGAVRDDTVLVTMMHVNNETGAMLPVETVGEALSTRKKTLFHVDGIQAFGKIKHCAKQSYADLYSVSGHKVGAPKGIGALYIREGLSIEPVLYGGGQEFGLRSGTENVLGIVAMGTAAERADAAQDERWKRVCALSEQLCKGLEAVAGCTLQRPAAASPYIVSASFPGLRGEVLVHALEEEGLYVSTGSACSSKGGHATDSHVLKAMGRSKAEVTGTLRFSMGWWTTEEDVAMAIDIVNKQVSWLRSLV
ncbi:cysteine desulfurase [Alicyclobacillus cycloheptanicus]|uniref:Cysteine desulfurase n=1 Tax=Alicyclobacillus cycloheptanicus TaxID=1457 RepID=A0ABT9XMI6_9BACL|nr:cysteine desulfurase family protein [Alicyclobacillus cycloheptanicus]MDQ0191239.1 cysteine desulfurase [Alicyclobacillus cycloheptanicus]WDM01525.1 cysteine desulfurase [Alicyclobacillus cycloheptanicus]